MTNDFDEIVAKERREARLEEEKKMNLFGSYTPVWWYFVDGKWEIDHERN